MKPDGPTEDRFPEPPTHAHAAAMRRAADLALRVQDACNLSGVVRTFHEVMRILWDEAHRLGEDAAWVNQHPVAVMFASKIESLTHCDDGEVSHRATEACKALAQTESPTPPRALGPAPSANSHELRTPVHATNEGHTP